MTVNDQHLADKLNAGILNRPAGITPEEAAKAMLPSLTDDEKAVLVATATDTMANNSRILKHAGSSMRHG